MFLLEVVVMGLFSWLRERRLNKAMGRRYWNINLPGGFDDDC